VDIGHAAASDECAHAVSTSEQTASWWLGEDGVWVRHELDENGVPLADMQSVLVKQISGRRRAGR